MRIENLWDFENADIHRLAIHTRTALTVPPALPYTVATIDGHALGLGNAGVLYGAQLANDSGDALVVQLTDDTATGDDAPLLATLTADDQTITTLTLPTTGVRYLRGITVTTTATGGTVLLYALPDRLDPRRA